MPRMKHRLALIIAVIVCLSFILLSCGRGGAFENKEKLAKENIAKIAKAIDTYFDKKGEYPDDLNLLKEKGFMSRFPRNPYQKEGSRMMVVKVSAPVAGDFSYLKIYRGRFSDEIMYYVLILWGPVGHTDKDVLDASYDYDGAHLLNWEEMPDGQPDNCLIIIKGKLRMMPEGIGEGE